MKILLVDDHVPIREQVKLMLGLEPDMLVVADVGSAEAGIEAARQYRPDVVVMDIMLPGMNGINATSAILSERPETRILVLSNHTGAALVRAVLNAGALGFVSKHRAAEELIPAIRSVAAGKCFLGGSAE